MDKNNNSEQTSSGFGFQFKSAREEKKLNIADIAKELNILQRHLEAIERNDFDSLPQLAFTKGFVSSYAKYLKLDVNNVMSHFNSIYPTDDAASTTEFTSQVVVDKKLGKVSRDNHKKTNFGGLGVFFALVGILGIGFIYYSSVKKSKPASADIQTQTVIEQLSGDSVASNSAQDNIATQVSSSQSTQNESGADNQANQNTNSTVLSVTDSDSAVNSQVSSDYIQYKVKRGDGLIALANKHNISVAKLAELNNLKANQNLLLGQVIKIPKVQSE